MHVCSIIHPNKNLRKYFHRLLSHIHVWYLHTFFFLNSTKGGGNLGLKSMWNSNYAVTARIPDHTWSVIILQYSQLDFYLFQDSGHWKLRNREFPFPLGQAPCNLCLISLKGYPVTDTSSFIMSTFTVNQTRIAASNPPAYRYVTRSTSPDLSENCYSVACCSRRH